MKGKPARINQPANVERLFGRLSRVRRSIEQLEAQLKTPFRHADSKAQAESKLAKLKGEDAKLTATIGELKGLIEKFEPKSA